MIKTMTLEDFGFNKENMPWKIYVPHICEELKQRIHLVEAIVVGEAVQKLDFDVITLEPQTWYFGESYLAAPGWDTNLAVVIWTGACKKCSQDFQVWQHYHLS